MKNKKMKILVPALAILALGLGAASAGTVAWFTATQSLQQAGDDEKFDVKSTAIDLGDIKLYLEVDTEHSTTTGIDLTDNAGSCWAVIQNSSTNKYYYRDVSGTSGVVTTGTLKLKARAVKVTGSTEVAATYADMVAFAGQTYTYTVTGQVNSKGINQTRVSENNTGDVFTKTSVDVSVTIVIGTDNYSFTYSPADTLYYSVSGGAKVSGIKDGDECASSDVNVDADKTGMAHIIIAKKA